MIREPFLTDDLSLERLHGFAHPAFLFELLLVRRTRVVQARGHHDERVLQLSAFEVMGRQRLGR